ncbi:hypothetical protein PGT21_018877 [Puccinia graminis f. sp. tritici]|uniref:Uncharacterized protein n=2 Tax=Puccinia graminis f. sp. tritici TaxID=56615 RepID=A0A5B0R919_PUCGR|nr:hypothetical protein PGT21_018877 [Puccinia graminis f. sp. tritici]KAA1122216.1 hypothetical protein PGTUg99_034343 [Puccinia graminis f. sp. tritici]
MSLGTEQCASNPTDEAQSIGLQADSCRRRIRELSEALKEEQSRLERLEAIESSLIIHASLRSQQAGVESRPNEEGGMGPKRKAYQAVKPEVKELVIQNVFDKGMTQRKVSESFGLSERTVRRIIKAEKNIHSGLEPAPKRRRGAKTKLTNEIMSELLFKLERQPNMTLSDMKRYVSETHAVTCTPQSISRMLSSMDVNWKTTLKIPPHWNETNILRERHDFVVRRAIDVDKQLIFVGDTGFDLNFNRSQDPSCSEQGASLSLVPRTSQATLLGAMSTSGYVYHEIINPDGKRVTGLSREDYEEFLIRLSTKLDSRRSVVIVERAKLAGGKEEEEETRPLEGRLAEHFREPDSLASLLSSTHPPAGNHHPQPSIIKTEIDYLPACSGFLSPLEISFVDLKNHIKSLDPPIHERSQLILHLTNAIHSLFPAPKPQDLFNFVAKELYPNCFNLAPISGPIIKHPDAFQSPPLR